MDQDLKRISSKLKLPRESRERIRAQLASCQNQKEEIPVKKAVLKTRIPLIAAAVVMAMALTLTAGAAAVQFFRNDIIVASREDIPAPGEEGGPSAVGVAGPIGTLPATMEEMIESDRFKSDGWSSDETINGGVVTAFFEWDQMEVLSDDSALRSRRITRLDGAEKMEYTAENPASLVDTLTGRVTFDLSWIGEHYEYVPDANFSYVITDPKGSYVAEIFNALYTKPDGSGYFRLTIDNLAEADHWLQSYIVESSYETAYYYTSADGYEFLIRIHNGNVWVDCSTSHATISMYGAYLTEHEIEDILDNLQLSIEE